MMNNVWSTLVYGVELWTLKELYNNMALELWLHKSMVKFPGLNMSLMNRYWREQPVKEINSHY